MYIKINKKDNRDNGRIFLLPLKSRLFFYSVDRYVVKFTKYLPLFFVHKIITKLYQIALLVLIKFGFRQVKSCYKQSGICAELLATTMHEWS